MSILLIRHGETALNVARVLQPADTPLSDHGLAQALALAQCLAGMKLAGIVSSDLPRALMTAQAISSATGLPVGTTALLRERNFGDLRGQAYDRLGLNPMTLQTAPPGGESMTEFEARVALAFAHVVALGAGLSGPLAVVSHGLVIGVMLERHLHAPPAVAQVPNSSVSMFSADPPYHLASVGCTRHLEL